MDATDAESYPGPHVKIDGSRYPLPENWTYEEARWIRRKTDLRVGDMMTALRSGDPDFGYAYGAVALFRSGLTMEQVERILDSKADTSVFVDFRTAEEQKAEATGKPVPPDEPAAAGDRSPQNDSMLSMSEIPEPTGAQG